LVKGVIFSFAITGSIPNESSISTTTGTAPATITAEAVEIHVYADTNTCSIVNKGKERRGMGREEWRLAYLVTWSYPKRDERRSKGCST
jgi:hypothetical protein